MKLPFWPNPKGYRDIDLNLDRIKNLLSRINNPHKNLPPTIHIAGTNGKGSTLAFLREILQKHGKKIHLYTSPHLVEFNERIILAGQKISDKFLNECLEICKKACEISPKIEVTYFEGITAAAFLAFSKIDADFLLLETGMGGKFDATNVVENILCAIITPISMDHSEFLGDTIAKIAEEKSGILKKNSPVIIAKQYDEALDIVQKKAQKLNCKTYIFDQDFKIEINENHWNFFSKIYDLSKLDFAKNLIGQHQIQNAALALSAITSQKLIKIDKNLLNLAIQNVFWPARLQRINDGVFTKKISQNSEIFLDGSHNIAGAKTIKYFLQKNSNKNRTLIFSMLQDKDPKAFLQEIASEIDLLITIAIENETKSRTSQELQKIASEINIKNIGAKNFNDAFSKAQDGLILICGSLYLAGDFIEKNELD